MAGLQTRTYTLAASSLVAGTFTSISQLLGSSQSTTNPEGDAESGTDLNELFT